jgi:SAM-dependent methyltransferase
MINVTGNKLIELFSLGELYVSDFVEDQTDLTSSDLTLYLDKKSGLVQLGESIDYDKLYRKYWYSSGTNETMRKELKRVVEDVCYVTAPKGSWLDIGCNDGTLLGFVPKGMDRVGCDPSDVAGDSLGNYSLINDYFTAENVEKYGKFKVVTAIAMFYDLVDPVRFLRDVYDVLEEDGVFVIQMSYLPLMIKQLAFDNIVAEHLCYYTLQSLMYFLNQANLKVVDCKLNDVNGGSFVVHAQKTCATTESYATAPYRDVANWRIDATLEMEDVQKMSHVGTYRNFFKDVKTLKKRTVDFITKAVEDGKTVYGLGASTKGNTLLQYYGLDESLITAISERQPKKHGLRTVGTNIPICSEEALREANPDYVLVLPWHFIHELKGREKKYLKNGGKFIVPCPRFEVINAG